MNEIPTYALEDKKQEQLFLLKKMDVGEMPEAEPHGMPAWGMLLSGKIDSYDEEKIILKNAKFRLHIYGVSLPDCTKELSKMKYRKVELKREGLEWMGYAEGFRG